MIPELKGQICAMDPQQVAFQEGVRKWISNEMTYKDLIQDLYPSYELRPHERIARVIRNAVKKLSNPQH